jgi:hypothetical protein
VTETTEPTTDPAPPARPGEGIEWKVGNKVLVEEWGDKSPREATLTKVGRKWAEVETYYESGGGRRTYSPHVRFEIATGVCEGGWGRHGWRLWADLATFERRKQRLAMEFWVTAAIESLDRRLPWGLATVSTPDLLAMETALEAFRPILDRP